MPNEQISQARIRELLTYDPESGEFTWLRPTSNRVAIGSRAGAPHNRGYVQLQLDGKNYLAHRLAWLYMHGSLPNDTIDHINGIRTDNRIANLRNVPLEVNNQNMRRAPSHNKTSGLLGASWNARECAWYAHISVQNKTVSLGRFPSAELAHEAYLMAKRRLHEGCTI